MTSEQQKTRDEHRQDRRISCGSARADGVFDFVLTDGFVRVHFVLWVSERREAGSGRQKSGARLRLFGQIRRKQPTGTSPANSLLLTTTNHLKMSLQAEISQLLEVLDFLSDPQPPVRRIALANLL